MSEHLIENHFCRFCQGREPLAYYCENCGASCCSDCLDDDKVESLVCQDCNSKNIQIQESEEKKIGKIKICADCGSENVINVTQYIKSCPKCHSHRIINIYEKKEKLEQTFLELIKETRNFLDPFREVINNLYMIREKVKKARAPPIRCYHFPKMESELFSLFKLLKYIEDQLLEKISIHFHHLSLNKEYFFDIYSQPNTSIRIIEGILENLYRSRESIDEFIEDNIGTINNDIESIKKNLSFIDKITKYFTEYKRFINLADDEKPVYAINAKLSSGTNYQDIFKRRNGILFITNLDLSFVHEYGFFKKKQELIFKAPVDDLQRIKEKGKLFKKLYIKFAYGEYEFSLPNKAISRVIEYILLARNFDETAIYDKESAKKIEKLNADLTNLKNFIEDGINSFFSLKCKINNEKNHDTEKNNLNYANRANGDYPEYSSQNPNSGNYNQGYQQAPIRYENNSYQSRQNQYPHRQNNYHNDNRNTPPPPNYYINPYIEPPYQQSYPNNQNHPYNSQSRVPHYNNHQYGTSSIAPNDTQYPNNSNHSQNFRFQNILYPNRYQNYNPRNFSRNEPIPSNSEEKNILMKQLERFQKQGFPNNNLRNAFNDYVNQETYSRSAESFYNNPRLDPSTQDYTRNYLSEYFRDDNLSFDPKNYQNKDHLGERDDCHKKMTELKKERFSVHETLKNLDRKFDEGKITEVDYLRAFKNLKQDLYMINKKIRSLDERIRENEAIKNIGRKYDNKKYFS
ncbi:MAG: hypothetical protein BAJALOKI3v1_360012 [Promethearchaeota archaeon]|nr:MAG: hypothetical protein BAJALOKI3v1_360012 [Candidatus Lokiarchaeota archaeon]